MPTMLLHIDGTEHTAGPGAVASIPRGTPHAFLVISERARWLGFVTPGTAIEAFMRDAGDPAPRTCAAAARSRHRADQGRR